MRRQKPSVHAAFGVPLAVLTGDALIVAAFETLARGVIRSPTRLAGLVGLIARAAGSPSGIVAGQAWESEPYVDLVEYQQAKTGALFAAATVAGAAAAGRRRSPGACSADASGRLIRSPTICATSPAARRKSASPPAAMPPSGARTRRPCSGWAAP